MTPFVPPRPPEHLRAVYDIFAARFSASGLRLANYSGRWIAFKDCDAADPRALPLLDEEPQDDGPQAFEEFQRRARAAGPGDAAIIYVMLERQVSRPARREPAGSIEILSIAVQSSAHGVGLLGFVALDDQGSPASIGPAMPLVLDIGLLG